MKFTQFSALMILLAACALGAWGQSTASLSGTVTDPSGAVVPNAQVTVHSLGTGLDRVVKTDAAGIYVVPSLQPGDYKVQATATGFSAYTVPKVTLDVDRAVTVNMHLAISAAGETVQVQSAVQEIEAQTITVGQVIDNTAVQDLPLNGRHFLDLTVLTPGSVVADTAGSLTATSRGLGANAFMTAGNREDSINFQINGINLNDISQNQITFQPSISTTSEFKIDNSTFSAEYGRSDGSIVTVATRSGTDNFHGEAFDYFRNEALDARWYFNRPYNVATGLPLAGNTGDKAPLKRNNFGGSAGGPIFRGHTFFYASYEALRQHQGILQNSPVISQANQTAIAANKTAEPIAAALAALIPLPNSGANYVSFTPGPVRIDQGTMDILQKIGPNDNLHGFYALQEDTRTEPALQGDTIPGWGDHRHAVRQIGTFSETHIFNNSMVNEARLGFNRINIAFVPANTIDPTSVGLGDGLSGPKGLPQTTLSDIGLVFGGPSGFPQGRADTAGRLVGYGVDAQGQTHHQVGRRVPPLHVGQLRRQYRHADVYHFHDADQLVPDGHGHGLQHPAEYRLQPRLCRLDGSIRAGQLQTDSHIDAGIRPALRVERNAGGGSESLHHLQPQPLSPSPRWAPMGWLPTPPTSRTTTTSLGWDLRGTSSAPARSVLRGGYAYLVDQPVAGVVTGMASNPPFSTAVNYNGAAIPLSSLYASAAAFRHLALRRQPQLQERVYRELQPERAAGAALGHGGPDLLRRIGGTPSRG